MNPGDRRLVSLVLLMVALTLALRVGDWWATVPAQDVFPFPSRWCLPGEVYRAIYGLDQRTQLVMRDGTAWRYRQGAWVLEERGAPVTGRVLDAPAPTPVEVAP